MIHAIRNSDNPRYGKTGGSKLLGELATKSHHRIGAAKGPKQ